ncbi:MAG TPA: SGNH/GDSL hydrolase family protein [Actinomycetota bacterium]|nr:SGNH/GDSL hydrolase family protein [Actinomycetota bacterium]
MATVVAVLAGALPSTAVTTPRSHATAAVPTTLASPNAYVALGDSYAAGPGIPTEVHSACQRSDHNYPSLVADALLFSSFRDATCSGATTDDMTGSQQTNPYTFVPPQFDALGPDARLVSVTIGGNDIGFASVAGTCVELGLLNPFGAPCEEHYTEGGIDALAAAVAAAAPKVAAVLQGIHQRSPLAKVIVVGYLDILPVIGPGCPLSAPVAAGDVPYLRGVEEELNRMLASQANLNGAIFVDTYSPSIGHDVCEPIGVKWIEGVVPTSPAAPLHPNLLGMQAAAAVVLSALR